MRSADALPLKARCAFTAKTARCRVRASIQGSCPCRLNNCSTVDLNPQLFRAHVDTHHHVLVDGLRGQTVLLSKGVQPPITPDEAHQKSCA
jgi:hypothetical protein